MPLANAGTKTLSKLSFRHVSAAGGAKAALALAFLLPQLAAFPAAASAAAESAAASATTLAVSVAGTPATSIASGKVATLTATVTSGGAAVSPGQVNFCDAAAKYCEDIHVLATVQLTKAGTAVYKFRPGIGSHSYKAVFLGTKADAASSSAAMTLTVTGDLATATSLAEDGFPGAYSLTATVAGVVNKPGLAAPTGKVSLLDSTQSNKVLASASLGSGTSSLGFSLLPSSPSEAFGANTAAAADFNGDGIPDVAVANIVTYDGNETLNILLGKGDGTFTQAPAVSTWTRYSGSVVAGDFNGDGIPDLAFTNNGDVEVSILLGYGNGVFKHAPNVIAGAESSGIATADFNHDGIADLAIVVTNGIQIFLGNGDGTFQTEAKTVPLTGVPIGVVAGDFNGDGKEDLAVTNGSSVFVFFGDGDGGFTSAPGTATEIASAQGIAIGDFNGDGIPDLVAANYDGYDESTIAILIGKGDGTFKTPEYYGLKNVVDPPQPAIADFNGDGIPDLVMASAWSDSIFVGKGDGAFTAAGTAYAYAYTYTLGPAFIAVADFNGDGIPDMAVPSPSLDSTALIILTQPSQKVTATLTNINPAGPGTQQIVASYSGDAAFKASVSTPVGLTPALNALAISPAAGTYTSEVKITITETTPGATIYYQASGPASTVGFVQYTGPFFLPYGGTEQITAYATETGYQQTYFTDWTYVLALPAAPTPVFSVAAGSYKQAQTVSIADTAANAKIFYTTNGVPPGLYSTAYTGPIAVSTSELISAIAIAPGYSGSSVASAQYLIGSSQSRFVYTVAGTQTYGYSGDGGPATFASLESPNTVARDASGNLYIAAGTRVRKIAVATGIITTFAGDGVYGYRGDGGPATKAEIGDVYGLALDAEGNLYIADESNCVVRKVQAGSGTISTVAGIGICGYSGDNGPAAKAELEEPTALAVDKAGNLYIGVSNRIRKVAVGTGAITTFAGNGEGFIGIFTGDGGPATQAELGQPSGMGFDAAGNLYFADYEENVVRKISATNSIITTVAGMEYLRGVVIEPISGDGGPATRAILSYPDGLAVDAAGDLFISDTNHEVVREVTASDQVIDTIAGWPFDCNSLGGDGGPALAANLCVPEGLAIDPAGNLYVADTYFDTVREITAPVAPPTVATAAPVLSLAPGTYPTAKTLSITAAPGAEVYLSLSGSAPTTSGQGYYTPVAIAGPVTVNAIALEPGHLPSSTLSATYNVTAPAAATIATVAGSGVQFSPGIGGPALKAEFGDLGGVAADASGNLYISDTENGVVWKLTAATQTVSVAAGTPGVSTYYSGEGGPATKATFGYSPFVAVDAAGDLFIADYWDSRILKVTAKTGIISTYAGGSEYIFPTLGDGGPATSAFLTPLGIAFDASGNLYIADTASNRIRRVDAVTGIISSVAGDTGATSLGDGGPATAAMLNFPLGIAFDGSGNLYIVDSGNSRIREVAKMTGIITTVAGNGNAGFGEDGILATQASIRPSGIAVNSSGTVYFGNIDNTVRTFVPGGTLSTLAGTGYWGFAGDGGPAQMAEFCGDSGLGVDSAGSLYIADECNYRVRKVTFAMPAPPAKLSPGNPLP